jgi:hypothetical protein
LATPPPNPQPSSRQSRTWLLGDREGSDAAVRLLQIQAHGQAPLALALEIEYRPVGSYAAAAAVLADLAAALQGALGGGGRCVGTGSDLRAALCMAALGRVQLLCVRLGAHRPLPHPRAPCSQGTAPPSLVKMAPLRPAQPTTQLQGWTCSRPPGRSMRPGCRRRPPRSTPQCSMPAWWGPSFGSAVSRPQRRHANRGSSSNSSSRSSSSSSNRSSSCSRFCSSVFSPPPTALLPTPAAFPR